MLHWGSHLAPISKAMRFVQWPQASRARAQLLYAKHINGPAGGVLSIWHWGGNIQVAKSVRANECVGAESRGLLCGHRGQPWKCDGTCQLRGGRRSTYFVWVSVLVVQLRGLSLGCVGFLCCCHFCRTTGNRGMPVRGVPGSHVNQPPRNLRRLKQGGVSQASAHLCKRLPWSGVHVWGRLHSACGCRPLRIRAVAGSCNIAARKTHKRAGG